MKVFLIAITLLLLHSCEKYGDFSQLEEIENSFSGSISVTESTGDINVTFSGLNDSGAYGFIWDNPARGAILNADVSVDSGSVQFIFEDARGNEVLNTITSGESVFSIEGKKGKWKVRIVFIEFAGDGNFGLYPVN